MEGFPGGSVVKSPSANAGDGFDPWSRKIARATEQLSLCATTVKPVLQSRAWELQLLKPVCSRALALQWERPLQ